MNAVITFQVEDETGRSNQVAVKVDIDNELRESLNRDMTQGGHNLARWIQNNLFGEVQRQVNPRGDWRPVSCSVQRL
jgi:hypothetical protein